jgi:hypothetical protein
VHGGSKDVPVLEHHGAEMAADTDGNRLTVDLELGMGGDLLLHLRGGVQGLVGRWKGRHDLVAHGLDDGAVALLSRAAHHVNTNGHHIAGAQVPHQLIEPCRPDDVGEQNGELDILAHYLRTAA